MSIEQQLERIAVASETTVKLLSQLVGNQAAPVQPSVEQTPVQATVAPQPTEQPVQQPTPAPVQQPVAQPVTNVPFSDHQGMTNYVMAAYSELGAEKGAGIQGVMQTIGATTINDIKPEHYPQLFEGVEQLKAQG